MLYLCHVPLYITSRNAQALGYRADQSRYSGNFDRGSTRVTTIVVVTVVTVVVVVGMRFAVAAIA
jgi:hypothetical protein